MLNSHLGSSLPVCFQQRPVSDGQMDAGSAPSSGGDAKAYYKQLWVGVPIGNVSFPPGQSAAQGTGVNVLCKHLSGLIDLGLLLSLTDISNPSS